MTNIFQLVITQPLANGLVLFYQLLGQNLGLAIIGFSLFLRLALTPLTKPYMESMKKMREYGPQLAKLKEKYKGDQPKFLQAQADFYREKGINPGAGCLPYIIQIVILIAFFNMFRKILLGEGIAVELNKLLYEGLKFAEGATVNTKFTYLDLASPDKINISGLPFAIPGPLLIAGAGLQAVVAKLSQGQLATGEVMAKKTKTTTDDMTSVMQSSFVYTMPLITLFAFMSLPSGVALYWITFSLVQAVGQLSGTPAMKKILNMIKFGDGSEDRGRGRKNR